MKPRRANTSALARLGKEKAKKLVVVVDDHLAFHGDPVTRAANGEQALENTAEAQD